MGRGWQGPAAIRGDQAPPNRPSPPWPVPRGLPGACGAPASLVQAWCRLCGSAFTPGLRSARSSVGGLGGAPTTPMGRETPGARGQQVSFPGEAGPEGRGGRVPGLWGIRARGTLGGVRQGWGAALEPLGGGLRRAGGVALGPGGSSLAWRGSGRRATRRAALGLAGLAGRQVSRALQGHCEALETLSPPSTWHSASR